MFNNKRGAVQFLRFCTVGVGNTAVDMASFLLLTLGGVPYLPAQALSYAAGMANSFFVNRRWTFRAAGQADASEVVRFVIVNGLSLAVSSGLLFILHDAAGLHLWLGKVAATAGGVAVNFMGSRLWVFSPAREHQGA